MKDFIVKYKSLRPLYQLGINALLVYLLWIVFYTYFRYSSFVDFFYNEVTYYLTNSWLYSTKLFYSMVGHSSSIDISRKLITLSGTAGVILERGCLGRNMMGLFVGFILVYPGPPKTKLWYIPFGLTVIYILNMLRIAGLGFTQLYYPEYMDINHHTVFKYAVYSAIFILWAFWISKLSQSAEEEVSSEVEK